MKEFIIILLLFSNLFVKGQVSSELILPYKEDFYVKYFEAINDGNYLIASDYFKSYIFNVFDGNKIVNFNSCAKFIPNTSNVLVKDGNGKLSIYNPKVGAIT